MFIITFKTILNDKVGYQFCRVIELFWLQQEVVQDTKDGNSEEIMNIFIRSSRYPQKNCERPPG